MAEESLLQSYKNGKAPWWVETVERLGLPTFLLFVVLFCGWWVYKDVRVEWRTANKEVVKVLNEFVLEQRSMNETLEDLVEKH